MTISWQVFYIDLGEERAQGFAQFHFRAAPQNHKWRQEECLGTFHPEKPEFNFLRQRVSSCHYKPFPNPAQPPSVIILTWPNCFSIIKQRVATFGVADAARSLQRRRRRVNPIQTHARAQSGCIVGREWWGHGSIPSQPHTAAVTSFGA
jgi:hypothetical protein